MKHVSSIKTNSKNESPKTPGGISKSLLTPCRRVGLSRNWKKKGPSPFISPLASSSSYKVEVVELRRDSRKRKSVVEPDDKTDENVAVDAVNEVDITVHATNKQEIVKTPLRNVELPRRKKSKTFLSTLNSPATTNVANSTTSLEIDDCTKENKETDDFIDRGVDIETTDSPNVEKVTVEDVLPLRNFKSIKSKKFQSPLKATTKLTSNSDNNTNSVDESAKKAPDEIAKPKKKKSESKTLKTRSPNELTKECIVVIQKKLLKVKENYVRDVSDPKKSSQSIFDSDDEAPLSTLNKKGQAKLNKLPSISDDDDEFMETSKSKVKKPEPKKTKIESKPKAQVTKVVPSTESKAPSQSSLDDDDDDFFDKKKTILIRKTYDKVSKLNKAKSTGSITQKDIDDIKARIDVKKKMLLARSMTAETEELRSLIKKWQKGCQEALVELMDLMRVKCPDKHDMDYSEILQMLKIPPSLVGYDSDHDCFNTPDDTSAVLSKYNDY